jgi:sec-independent protein translocase protein TatC
MSDPQPNDELAGTEQPFVHHLMELRDRLLYSAYGIALAVAVLAFWPGPSGLIDFIAQPIRAHMPEGAKLIAVGVFSPFFVPLKVLMMVGVLAVLPWLMYQMWAFVAPGLYSHEKKFALPLIVFGSLLAYGGIAFVQFFVLDKMFGFIQSITPASVAATPDIASYVEAILSLYLAFGMAFQVPIVVMLLVRFNLVSIEKLREFRGYFVVVAFVIAAVVTPPDVISQLALAIPMCVLYEVGILGARWFVKVSKAPEESAVSQESDEAKEPQGSDDPQKPKEPEGPGPTV